MSLAIKEQLIDLLELALWEWFRLGAECAGRAMLVNRRFLLLRWSETTFFFFL